MCVFAYLHIWAAGLKIQKTPSEIKIILSVLLHICAFVFKAKKSQPNHTFTSLDSI
jgi:hypothetical protein